MKRLVTVEIPFPFYYSKNKAKSPLILTIEMSKGPLNLTIYCRCHSNTPIKISRAFCYVKKLGHLQNTSRSEYPLIFFICFICHSSTSSEKISNLPFIVQNLGHIQYALCVTVGKPYNLCIYFLYYFPIRSISTLY